MSEQTAAQLEQEIDRLSAQYERDQDRGVTVTPQQWQHLSGLRVLLASRRKLEEAKHVGNDDSK